MRSFIYARKRLVAWALLLVGIFACLQACAPIRLLNLDLATDQYRAYSDIAYGLHQRTKLDFYLPAGGITEGKPVVVWIYGGSWENGRKQDYTFIASWLTQLGYAVVIPDYRLYPGARFPDFVEDTARAVAWARTAPALRADAAKAPDIVLIGHSAGAYNAAMVALDRQWLEKAGASGAVTGFVGLAGAYDFHPYDVSATRNAFGHIDDPSITQPVRRIQAGSLPPSILLHGVDDTLVYPRNSESLARALTAYGHDATLVLLDDVDHKSILTALSPLLADRSVRQPIEAFLASRSTSVLPRKPKQRPGRQGN